MRLKSGATAVPMPASNRGRVPVSRSNSPLLSRAEKTPWSSPMISRVWPVSGSIRVTKRCWSVPSMSKGIQRAATPLLLNGPALLTRKVALVELLGSTSRFR